MSFLTPLFLLGALAVAFPVVFHLIRRTTRQRVSFSSLMFLESSPPRLTRRSRLEHILLLLLRCAVICLLALGFARPFIKKSVNPAPATVPSRRIVLLVDISASMKRANLWADARARVQSILDKTSPADQLALFVFDRHVHPLLTFEQWDATPADNRAALAAGKLAESSPSWLATDLGGALVTAAESLADTAGKPSLSTRQIVLVSDLQEGSHLEALQNYEWPKGIGILLEPLQPRYASNAGLQLVANSEESRPNDGQTVRVRVNNASTSKREQFKIGWAQPDGHTFAGHPIDLYVPAGQSRTSLVPAPPGGISFERIILQGDEDDFDNTVFVVPPEQARLSVLYCGSESETDSRGSLYFLKRAFQETRRQAVEVLVRPQQQPLLPAEIQSASLFVVTAALSEERSRLLHDQVSAGKMLLFSLANQEAALTLARFLGVPQIAVEEAKPSRYAMLAEIDFKHPLFAPFADPRFSDFTKIHFWKYRRFDAATIPGARVLAKFDDGDPAVVDAPVGKGRVIILASGWGSEDSQLALSTKFVPLLYSMLEQSGTTPPLPAQLFVGDPLPLASLAGVEHQALTIKNPEGLDLKLSASETNFSNTLTPGIYRLEQPPRRFAVNLDASESRTVPLSVDELERRGVLVSHQLPAIVPENQRPVRLQNAELENRQKLWRALLVAGMAMLLLETWLAGRAARRVLAQPQSVT